MTDIKNGGYNEVPCGHCENCVKRRVSNWSFRLMQEEKVSLSSYFITLTYDSEHVPITKNGFMDLSKRDFQLFFKRFRKQHDSYGKHCITLKYYAVGEYGGKFRRPHYHFIVFNADLSLIIGSKNASAVSRGIIKLDGQRTFTTPSWTKGHITVGQVSEASVGYTMKYMSKPWNPMHRNDDRTPQFCLMSKGLGASYLTGAMIQWHKSDMANRQYCNLKDGKKVAMPRYYRTKLLNEEEKQELITLKMFDILYNITDGEKPVNTAKDRSEAYYAGLDRLQINYVQNQKF